MRFLVLIYFLLLFVVQLEAQIQGAILNPKYEKTIKGLLQHTVPEISCEQLKSEIKNVILLDTREMREYEVSHIPGARFVGYNNFKIEKVKDIPKDKKIVCYCSVGYRSEKVAEKLINAGYTNVYNLYGSIFEWVNRKYAVERGDSNLVKEVHPYNFIWGRWIDNKEFKKKY